MTTRDKVTLLELLNKFNNEELNCSGDCSECFYGVEPYSKYVDNCPLLLTYDMVLQKFNGIEKWIKK